jgi:hypothetical protein
MRRGYSIAETVRYTRRIMQRPSGVSLTAALMVLFTLIGLLGTFTAVVPATAAAATPFAVGGLMKVGGIVGSLIGLLFVFLYWKGYGWVRWVVMIYCVLTLVSLLGIRKAMQMSHLIGVSDVLKALLALFLLYYLNTEPVKAWFNGPKIA